MWCNIAGVYVCVRACKVDVLVMKRHSPDVLGNVGFLLFF